MENELAKTNTGVPATTGRRGFEEPSDKSDLIFPRAKIFQGSMKEQEAFPGIIGGEVINNLTGEKLSGKFVPIFKFTNYIKFNAMNKDDPDFNDEYGAGAVIWNTNDPHDERTKECEFGANGEKPTATKFMNFMCIFEDDATPIVLSFSKTSYPAGKKLLSMLTFSQGDMWSRKFAITTKKENDASGNIYFIYQVSPAGLSTEEEQTLAEQYYTSFASRTKEIEVEQGDVKWSE